MVPELSREEQIARGQRVAQILGDPTYKEAVLAAERDIIEDWKRADASPAAREDAWYRMQGLIAVGYALANMYADGQIASRSPSRQG